MNAFRRACYGLGAMGLLLAVAHLFWPEYEWGQGRSSYFNLGNSLTLASWLLSMQLVLAAGLCLVGFHRERWGGCRASENGLLYQYLCSRESHFQPVQR